MIIIDCKRRSPSASAQGCSHAGLQCVAHGLLSLRCLRKSTGCGAGREGMGGWDVPISRWSHGPACCFMAACLHLMLRRSSGWASWWLGSHTSSEGGRKEHFLNICLSAGVRSLPLSEFSAWSRASWQGPALACLVESDLLSPSEFVLLKIQEEASCPVSSQPSYNFGKAKWGCPACGYGQRSPVGLQFHLAHFVGLY